MRLALIFVTAVLLSDILIAVRTGCALPQEATAEGEWVSASEERVGGRAEDDKRLAWPGQGQVNGRRRGGGGCLAAYVRYTALPLVEILIVWCIVVVASPSRT